MQKTLLIKTAIITTLSAIFAIGLSMIQSLVYERQAYADSVISEIAEQNVRAQQVISPFLITESFIKNDCSNKTNVKKDSENKNSTDKCDANLVYISPIYAKKTDAKQKLEVSNETYKRSIYAATSYQGNLSFNQQFELSALTEANKDGNKPFNTRLLIPISDLRGVSELPTVTINGKKINASYPETSMIDGLNYLEVVLPKKLFVNKANTATKNINTLNIKITLPLSGLGKIQTVPLGEQFQLTINGNWHAPNFVGQALPNQKTMEKSGFNAQWQNHHVTTLNNQLLNECLNTPIVDKKQACHISDSINSSSSVDSTMIQDKAHSDNYNEISFNSFGVDFAQPNDVYLQTERTMKYALLLIAITFGSFFLFEVIKSLRIHPIQYLLVSMALLVFYALLLSLAEQITFVIAYAIAASACAGLIGWYAYYVLKSGSRAILFTLILVGQYAGFYALLTIEELNLLIGAVLCFMLIATVMYLTRKIDWYKIN